jgi:hypothetical protein
MTLPVGIDNETYVGTNIITHFSSSSASDTEIIKVEGHTVDGSGNFTFAVQTVTLVGQTKTALTTPLARVTRVVNTGSTDLIGNIYIYQDDTVSAGVPTTGAKVHLIVEAGLNNSEKASTTISSNDYWILTSFYGDCLEKTAAFGILHLEIREKGGVFVNKVDISCSTNARGVHEFKPYLVVPKNSDVRLRCSASATNKDFSGGIQGLLASVTV